jgi:hypothetical protein
MASARGNLMERLSVLQRLGIFGGVALGLLALAGLTNYAINTTKEKPFFTPGQVPSRDDCFYGKLAQFKNVTRQIIFQAAQECEIEVQSLEGHEQKRQEWIERQAERARQRASEPVVDTPQPEQEKDRVRRVWR